MNNATTGETHNTGSSCPGYGYVEKPCGLFDEARIGSTTRTRKHLFLQSGNEYNSRAETFGTVHSHHPNLIYRLVSSRWFYSHSLIGFREQTDSHFVGGPPRELSANFA